MFISLALLFSPNLAFGWLEETKCGNGRHDVTRIGLSQGYWQLINSPFVQKQFNKTQNLSDPWMVQPGEPVGILIGDHMIAEPSVFVEFQHRAAWCFC